jgi:hypothetical protein
VILRQHHPDDDRPQRPQVDLPHEHRRHEHDGDVGEPRFDVRAGRAVERDEDRDEHHEPRRVVREQPHGRAERVQRRKHRQAQHDRPRPAHAAADRPGEHRKQRDREQAADDAQRADVARHPAVEHGEHDVVARARRRPITGEIRVGQLVGELLDDQLVVVLLVRRRAEVVDAREDRPDVNRRGEAGHDGAGKNGIQPRNPDVGVVGAEGGQALAAELRAPIL